MSVRITNTCISLSYAKYSAAVRANLGVIIRSMVGSDALFINNTTLSIDPFFSKSVIKNLDVSILTPIAAKTIAKFSSELSNTSLCLTNDAYRQIYAPISLCGRPLAEKSGIFYPLAIEFITSIEEIPVYIISYGYILLYGFIGIPYISKNSSANIYGPLSIGTPEPLNTLPNISSEIGIFNTSPVNST